MLHDPFCKFSPNQFSMENKMATPLGSKVFFRNKETMSQCNDQGLEPIIVENLVIHFDQEKFKGLLSGGSLVLHARKHRKISVAKASVVTEQKPTLAGQTTRQASPQLLSASTEATSASRKTKQVLCEPKTSIPKQMWRPKQKAPCEASGEVPPQLRLLPKTKPNCLFSLAASPRLLAARLDW